MIRTIAIATAIAGTLDLLSAFVFAGIAGAGPVAVLQFVASGPLGDVALGEPSYALAGLLTHYAIMACMAAAYILTAARLPPLARRPILAGAAYGLLLWLIMYWIVRPLRWPAAPLPDSLWDFANQLFSHIILVGIPIALVAARGARIMARWRTPTNG